MSRRDGRNLGNLLPTSGKPNDAADAYRRGIEAAETLTGDKSGTRKYCQFLAEAHADLGLTYSRVNRFQDAVKEMGVGYTYP